jgi:2-polyprenyl-3-methyl-5-hydroxy-6-metoxy-1,4-benzoquinol methylase
MQTKLDSRYRELYEKHGEIYSHTAIANSQNFLGLLQQDRLRTIAGQAKGLVVDIGCGDSPLGRMLSRGKCKVIGVDISTTMLSKAKKLAEHERLSNDFLAAAAENLPLRSNIADTVILAEIIEHIPNPEQILKEAFRVLKQNGKVIISTPNKYTNPYGVGAPDHLRQYTLTTFVAECRKLYGKIKILPSPMAIPLPKSVLVRIYEMGDKKYRLAKEQINNKLYCLEWQSIKILKLFSRFMPKLNFFLILSVEK